MLSKQDWRYYGWKHVESGCYSHKCGAKVSKDMKQWIPSFVDGSSHIGHATALQAMSYVMEFDQGFWDFQPGALALCPTGGVMMDGGEIGTHEAFTVRTCSRFLLAPYTERYFNKKVFGLATCIKCQSPMTRFRFETKTYLGDRVSRYSQNPGRAFRNSPCEASTDESVNDSSLAWFFLVCDCGSPIWAHPKTIGLIVGLRVAQNYDDRRLRMKNAEGYYTQQDIEEKLEQQNRQCAYCKVPFSDAIKYTVDHIVSLAAGGTHWPENICLACQPCNSRKGNLSKEDFAKLLETI